MNEIQDKSCQYKMELAKPLLFTTVVQKCNISELKKLNC